MGEGGKFAKKNILNGSKVVKMAQNLKNCVFLSKILNFWIFYPFWTNPKKYFSTFLKALDLTNVFVP